MFEAQGQFLKPQVITRAFQLTEEPSQEPDPPDEGPLFDDSKETQPPELIRLENLEHYHTLMNRIRRDVEGDRDSVLLYHYTNPRLIKMILKTGLRMSTQGQGDGGLYFSILGLGSYKWGTTDFERLLIQDCYGLERLEEYLGKGLLDAIMVVKVHKSVLSLVPGGRDNAVFIQRRTFETLGTEARDGSFYLPPSAIMGCFCVNAREVPVAIPDQDSVMAEEASKDQEQSEGLFESIRAAASWQAPPLITETLLDHINDITSTLTGSTRRASMSVGVSQRRTSFLGGNRMARRNSAGSLALRQRPSQRMPLFSRQNPPTFADNRAGQVVDVELTEVGAEETKGSETHRRASLADDISTAGVYRRDSDVMDTQNPMKAK